MLWGSFMQSNVYVIGFRDQRFPNHLGEVFCGIGRFRKCCLLYLEESTHLGGCFFSKCLLTWGSQGTQRFRSSDLYLLCLSLNAVGLNQERTHNAYGRTVKRHRLLFGCWGCPRKSICCCINVPCNLFIKFYMTRNFGFRSKIEYVTRCLVKS